MKTKKIKDLLIGSNNAGKVREIKQLLPKTIRKKLDYSLNSMTETLVHQLLTL